MSKAFIATAMSSETGIALTFEAFPRRTQDVLLWNDDILESHLSGVGASLTHIYLFLAHDDPSTVCIDNKTCHTFRGRCGGIGHRKDKEPIGMTGICSVGQIVSCDILTSYRTSVMADYARNSNIPHLTTVQHPFMSALLRSSFDIGYI